MNRTDLLGFESSCTRRVWAGRPEIRASESGGLVYDGIASTTETAYDVYGGPPYGWTETIARGAFKRTLRNKADVAFLVNHEGITLARTKSGTLQLSENEQGLRVLANLDPRMAEVNSLRIAADRGDIDEMSFGFRVEQDEWFDANGEPSTFYEGTQRRITEVNLNKGDVSAVNYGANPTTSGGFRAVDVALAELRAGKRLDDPKRDLIRSLAHVLDEAPEQLEVRAMDAQSMNHMDVLLTQAEAAVAAMRDHMNEMASSMNAGPEGSDPPMGQQNSDLAEETRKRRQALHELLRIA